MHDLDGRNQELLKEVDSAADQYLADVRDLPASQRKDKMEKIQKMFQKAKEHGDQKVIKVKNLVL